jgi:hypothetical protein
MELVQKLGILSIGLILVQSSAVVAQSFNSYPSYVPRADTSTSSQQRRRASTSRGCEGEEKAQLTIIAPEDEVALTASNHPTFILTAGILCNPLRLSESIYARVAFKKVELSAQTRQKLARTTSKIEKAKIYAQEGIWYDAIALAYQSPRYFRYLISQSKLNVAFSNQTASKSPWIFNYLYFCKFEH